MRNPIRSCRSVRYSELLSDGRTFLLWFDLREFICSFHYEALGPKIHHPLLANFIHWALFKSVDAVRIGTGEGV